MTAKDDAEKPSGEQQLIRELAQLLNDTGLSEIEIEKSGLKVRVARTVTIAAAVPAASHFSGAPAPVSAPSAGPGAQPAPAAGGDPAKHPGAVKSPMVGTAYLAPEPGKPNFVSVGDKVNAGQTLLIIEAMKTFNPIKAPKAGTVMQVLIENARPVEFGEPLMIVE